MPSFICFAMNVNLVRGRNTNPSGRYWALAAV
jgi:hypothetical protein